MAIDDFRPTPFGFGWLIRWELSSPLLADVIVPSLYLPGEPGDGRGLVPAGLVQLADIVAVLGRVVLHGPNFVAFPTPELQDRKDSSKFTDHPVLKAQHAERQCFKKKNPFFDPPGSHTHTHTHRVMTRPCDLALPSPAPRPSC